MVALVTLAEVKDYLTISSTNQDAKLSNLITYVSDLVENYCSRHFTAANVTYEYANGGLSYIFVNRPPINNVYSLAEYDGTQYVPLTNGPTDGGLPNVAANANSAPGYTWVSDSGKIWKGFDLTATTKPPYFNNYPRGVRVEYNGGYATIPSDLKMCVLDIIKDVNKGLDAQITRFSGEWIQKAPYSAGFPPHIRRVLDLYRLIV